MAEEILQVKSPIINADQITNQQYHTYTPYTTSYNNNDEIRIAIQAQDLYVLPSDSYLYIEFNVEKLHQPEIPNDEIFFSQNFISHLFSELRYEVNGFEVDRCRSPGITSMMKLSTACKSRDAKAYALYALYSATQIEYGTYRMVLPLRFVFGFCDDFNKIVLNSKHELILVRNRTDANAYLAPAAVVNFHINKICWKIQHVSLSDESKLSMLKTLNRNDDLPMMYRSWDLYELPALPETTRHNWTVKTTTQLTKPRFVIVGFQTNRNYVVNRDISFFDNCNISDVKLYMNNERYPYDDMNLNFDESNYHEAYLALIKVQQSYYRQSNLFNPVEINFAHFKDRAIFAFDCTRSDETIKTGMVDIRLEITARQNIPANTSAFCLIIHDNLVWYSPFSSIVHRDI